MDEKTAHELYREHDDQEQEEGFAGCFECGALIPIGRMLCIPCQGEFDGDPDPNLDINGARKD